MQSYHDVGWQLVDIHQSFFHDDFVWISERDPAEFPLAGTYVGIKRFKEWLEKFEMIYVRDPSTFTIEFFTAADTVLASYRESYLVNGETLEMLQTYLRFKFKDNKVVEMRDTYDTARNQAFWARARRLNSGELLEFGRILEN